jgi:cysteine desulfurase
MIGDTIYLDHAATTPVDSEVLAAMQPFFQDYFGNPSSVYRLGQDARAAIDQARAAMSRVLACKPSELVVTSGATEGDNLALSGVAWAARQRNPDGPWPHIITSAIEHSAILYTAEWLEQQGFAVSRVACDAEGRIRPSDVQALIRPETCLVSVMYANNEVGTIQPVAEIAEVAHRHGALFHTDAVQSAGALSLSVDELNADLLTLSAHKFYGPKGVGLLYVRSGSSLAWTQRGGGQESGRRGGTENVPGIIGMAVALGKADAQRHAYNAHCGALRDRLISGLAGAVPNMMINGPESGEGRLPNNANVAFRGVQGETLLLTLDMEGVAASAGSACTAGKSEPSHVLESMGHSDERCRSSIRFTLGWDNTANEIDDVIDTIANAVSRVRDMAGLAS